MGFGCQNSCLGASYIQKLHLSHQPAYYLHPPPPPNRLKFNCDTSFVVRNASTSIVGVCRYKDGDWIISFQQKCLNQSALMGELQAILWGLLIIEDKGWSSVIVHSHSKQAVNRILQEHTIQGACETMQGPLFEDA